MAAPVQDEYDQYIIALSIAIALAIPFTVYNYIRIEALNLYMFNKVLADVAAVLLGFLLMIGPGSRLFHSFGKWLHYRKELGIISFFIVAAHLIISLFLVPDRFPLSRFFGSINIPFYFGLASTLVLAALYLISNDKTMNKLGRKVWWELQYWGVRTAFIMLYLHVVIMKWNEWTKYYQAIRTQNSTEVLLPSSALLTTIFMTCVITLRLYEFIDRKYRAVFWIATGIIYLCVYIITFYLALQ